MKLVPLEGQFSKLFVQHLEPRFVGNPDKETPQNKRVEYGQLQINGFWEAAATVVSVA